MLKAKNIDHINMNVRNLDETESFYRELFGFESKKDQPEFKSRIIGNDTIKLCIYEKPEMQKGTEDQNIAHFGFYIENFEEVLEACKRLNVPVTRNQEWEHSQSVYIEDPNGYDIELSKVQGGGL